jgi:hypothetical protein
MTEGGATIHTPRTLLAEFIIREGNVKFVPVMDAIEWRDVALDFAAKFDKACWFSHGCYKLISIEPPTMLLLQLSSGDPLQQIFDRRYKYLTKPRLG